MAPYKFDYYYYYYYFVNECLNFDVLEGKVSKTAKKYHHKNYGLVKGVAGARPPKYAPWSEPLLLCQFYCSSNFQIPRGRQTAP